MSPRGASVAAGSGPHADRRRAALPRGIVLGDYEAALATYREAMAIPPNEHAASMTALLLHRLGRAKEAAKAYSDLLFKLKRDHAEAPHALRGAAMLLRDAGKPIASERFMHETIAAYRRNPAAVAAALVERDNSIDYHGWTRYADKAQLARALQRHADKPWAPRFPETFVLPEDRETLLAYGATNPDALYIVKPQRGTGGRGIKITREIATAAAEGGVVVQRYVQNPCLVDGRKGHIRLYGLVASINPLRVYMYREGVVRFAPEPFDLGALGNLHAHVTNTALHEGHPQLVVSKDPAKEDEGAVWSLTAYLARLTRDGLDGEAVRERLRGLMRGFVATLAAEGLFADQAKAAPRRAFPMKLFGLDVLLDAAGEPWLIEAQRKPALAGSPLVNRINGRMFMTIFEMSCGYLFEDGTGKNGSISFGLNPNALAQLELSREAQMRGLFSNSFDCGA